MNMRTLAIERIEYAPACEVINLEQAERDRYHGCGETIARFQNGKLVELYRPMPPFTEDITPHDCADYCARAALQYAKNNIADECMLVMCSCYQLCNPEPIGYKDYDMLFDRFLAEYEYIYA